jgi:hypothetical protein
MLYSPLYKFTHAHSIFKIEFVLIGYKKMLLETLLLALITIYCIYTFIGAFAAFIEGFDYGCNANPIITREYYHNAMRRLKGAYYGFTTAGMWVLSMPFILMYAALRCN